MFNAVQQPSATSEEGSYIIKQNEVLQTECKQLRSELTALQKQSTTELNDRQKQCDEFEDDLDKADASLRYLRNLQRTLATLHLESKAIADGYKACCQSTEKHYTAQLRQTNYFVCLAMASYALTFTTSVGCDVSSSALVFATTGAGLYGAYRQLFKDDAQKAKAFQACSHSKKSDLVLKTKQYDDAVRGLPGIEELIDNV
jgi:iron uptake system EfeUOB component EfeO/EfeM